VSLGTQIAWLFILALPVAAMAWVITHEAAFSEAHDYALYQSRYGSTLLRRKFFYLLTCEYCFSHYVAIFFLLLTRYKLLYLDWRGYVIAMFALVWVANLYMSFYGRLRLDIRKERVEINKVEKKTGTEEEKIRRAA
jgi:hypothetical protein